jgi:hypothetical protein
MKKGKTTNKVQIEKVVKEVKVESTEVVEKSKKPVKEKLPKISTEDLLTSKEPKLIFGGFLRMLGDIEIARGDKSKGFKSQTTYNKISKCVENLRRNNIDEKLVEEVKLLVIEKTWLEIKNLAKDDEKVPSKIVSELYEKMLMFGRKNKIKNYDDIEISLF